MTTHIETPMHVALTFGQYYYVCNDHHSGDMVGMAHDNENDAHYDMGLHAAVMHGIGQTVTRTETQTDIAARNLRYTLRQTEQSMATAREILGESITDDLVARMQAESLRRVRGGAMALLMAIKADRK